MTRIQPSKLPWRSKNRAVVGDEPLQSNPAVAKKPVSKGRNAAEHLTKAKFSIDY